MVNKLRTFLALVILLFSVSVVKAQTSNIRGLLTDEFNNPMSGVKVTLAGTQFETTTENSGAFNFINVPFGDYQLEVKENDYAPFSYKINVSQPLMDVGKVSLLSSELKIKTTDEQLPMVTLDDQDIRESGQQSVSSALGASRDVFASAATFTFSTARYRIRGYDDENFVTMMNGVPMTDLSSGRTLFSSWGGVNDVMRSRESIYGLSPANYAFGGIGGAFSIDSRASKQRKQLQVSYANSNRAYENRLMVTYGTGILPGGWSFATSISRRWANEGYIPGSFYDGWSYFVSAEKIFKKHSISLTHFGNHTQNSRTSPATNESFDLAGDHYYNPNWGYQDGKKRSANNNNINVPVTILSHEWEINDHSSLETSLAYQAGKEKRSALQWLDAPNPRPDYYRKLPNYILHSGVTDPGEQAALMKELTNAIINNKNLIQVDWASLYEGNKSQIDTFNNVVGYKSNTIIEDRVEENNSYTASAVYNNSWDRWTFTGGASYNRQLTEYYKQVNDLLGGDFYVDLNQFAEEDFKYDVDQRQNDINNPNRVVKVGDKFGYDYSADIRRTLVWVQQQYKGNRFDAFVSAELNATNFHRTGYYQNGVFPENSFGPSETYSFTNFMIKTGLTYKINGRNYIFTNFGVGSRAPHFDQVFVDPTNRNQVQSNIMNQKINTVEGGYIYTAPRFKAKATIYNTNFNDGARVIRYFNDALASFVSIALREINVRNQGVELSMDANLGKGLSVTAVASVGNHYYTSRQLSSTFFQNVDSLGPQDEIIYSKNYKPGGVQSAYTVGATYRSKKFWMAGININYFDDIWVEMSPVRRTERAVEPINSDTEQWANILRQEKLKGQMTVDVFINKSWKLNSSFKSLKRNTFLLVNVGVNNIFNNTDFKTSGMENLRNDQSAGTPTEKFANRYFYSFGLNYFISVTLRMN